MVKLKRALVILFIALFVLSACGKKVTNKETLIDVFTTTSEYESFEGNFEATVEAEEDPTGGLLGTEFKLTGDIKANMKTSELAMNLKTSMMGMDINMEAFVKGDQAAFRIPFLTEILGMGNPYIIVDTPLESDVEEPDLAMIKKYTEALNKGLNEGLDEKQIEILEDEVHTTPTGDVKGKRIKINIQDGDIAKINAAVQKSLLEAGLITETEIDDQVTNGAMNIELFVDDKDRLISVKTDVQEIITDDDGIEQTSKVSFVLNLWNINDNVDLEIPEFTDDNSMTLEEFNNFGLFE